VTPDYLDLKIAS